MRDSSSADGIQERALDLPQLSSQHLVVGSRDAAKLDAPDVDSVRGLLRVTDGGAELHGQGEQDRTNEAQARFLRASYNERFDGDAREWFPVRWSC